jgi:hypothetical protein
MIALNVGAPAAATARIHGMIFGTGIALALANVAKKKTEKRKNWTQKMSEVSEMARHMFELYLGAHPVDWTSPSPEKRAAHLENVISSYFKSARFFVAHAQKEEKGKL